MNVGVVALGVILILVGVVMVGSGFSSFDTTTFLLGGVLMMFGFILLSFQVPGMRVGIGGYPPPAYPSEAERIEREVVREEIVKVRCSHCGTLNLETATNCSNCGAHL